MTKLILKRFSDEEINVCENQVFSANKDKKVFPGAQARQNRL
jgi:hypothetical protein